MTWASAGVVSPPQPDGKIVRCSVHGAMRFRFAGDWWVCPGWDGEGCCAVAAELVADHLARHPEAGAADVPALVAVPVESSPPSCWGYRAAILRQPEVSV
jgi:hypothetical protein